MLVNRTWLAAKLFLELGLIGGLGGCPALWAQSTALPPQVLLTNSPTGAMAPSSEASLPDSLFHFRTVWMPELPAGYMVPQAPSGSYRFGRMSWSTSPNTIDKMEAAFYCNDTPFVDQVRLPLATFWNGRVKLIVFESDVTTANFVLGLPGQGSLHSLSAFGNAFIATHTPPSDQLAGIHMTISLHPTDTDAGENSGLRGIEYLVRASRGFLPFLGARSDSISIPAR